MDPQVANYIDRYQPAQKVLLLALRELLLRTCPKLTESFKNGAPWYEDKFYLAAFNDHVNIGFSVSGLAENEQNLFCGKGRFMRHIRINNKDFDKNKIIKLIKIVHKKHTPCHCGASSVATK